MSFPAPSFLSFGPALPAGLTRRMASRGSWPGRAAIRVRTQRCLIWGLIAALCVYALSSSLLRIVGPQHWHAIVAQAAPATASGADETALAPLRRWLSGIRSLSDDLHARAHAMGMTAHRHSHSALLRHWHGQDDNTVRVVADDAPGARVGSTTLGGVPPSAVVTLGSGLGTSVLNQQVLWEKSIRVPGVVLGKTETPFWVRSAQ